MVNAKRLFGFLATGEMPEMTALDESLAEHDKKYHPDGYKEGDHCNRRDKGDEADSSLVPPDTHVPHVKITPAEDAAYLDAVKRGDMETCAKMVREAAAKAMPDTKVVDKDGLPKVVYRATTRDAILHVTDSDGLFMTTSKDNANEYTGKAWGYGDNEVFGLFANIGNPLVINADGACWLEIRVPQEINDFIERNHGLWHSEGEYEGFASTGQIIEAAKEHGYDGVILKNVYDELLADDVISFKSSVVKSADPVTYDDAGQPIPLSRRFDFTSDDIRY